MWWAQQNNVLFYSLYYSDYLHLSTYAIYGSAYRIRVNKGRSFYSKIIVSAHHNGAFSQNFVYIHYVRLH